MRRILLLAPFGALDHQTGILNAAEAFARAGYEVDVFAIRNSWFPTPAFQSSSIRCRFMPWRFNSPREPRVLATVLFSAWVLLRAGGGYDAIFAGGVRGLIAAYAYRWFRRTRIINYQMELYVGENLVGVGTKAFKKLEQLAARASFVSIEHTAERARLLTRDLGVPGSRIVIVPNAPRGPACVVKSTYLHRVLSLDPATPVLLCPGTFGEAFETEKLIRASRYLPAGWWCVLHSAQPRERDDPYIAYLRELANRARVALSLAPLPYARVNEVLGSARIGVALYSAGHGENFSTVGLASGKLSHFLKIGVPVIVSRLPGLADFVEEHQVGAVLDDPATLGNLIERIDADYSGFSTRSLACFDRYLSFESSFSQVIGLLEQSGSTSQRQGRLH